MTLITIEQFEELAEDYPELAQLIHIHDNNSVAEELIDYSARD